MCVLTCSVNTCGNCLAVGDMNSVALDIDVVIYLSLSALVLDIVP